MNSLQKTRQLRQKRTRARIKSSSKRLRLSVFKSNNYIYAQLIDDNANKTLASASSKNLKEKLPKTKQAERVGKNIAEKSINLGIKEVIFDRGRYAYHGCVKTLVESARKIGLKI